VEDTLAETSEGECRNLHHKTPEVSQRINGLQAKTLLYYVVITTLLCPGDRRL